MGLYKLDKTIFFKTLKVRDYNNYLLYKKVLSYSKKGYSYAKIARTLKLSQDKTRSWANNFSIPIGVKIINEADQRKYFTSLTSTVVENLAYLVGHNIGDGNVSENLCNTWFYGVNLDLKNVAKLFKPFKVIPVIYTYKINNGKMAIHDHVFSRFLLCAGAIRGNKTRKKTNIPDWIKNSKRGSSIKVRFLQGIFDSELSKVEKEKSRPNSFKTLKIYQSKTKERVEEGKFFLNEIKSMLKEFNITSTTAKSDRVYIKKNGEEMQEVYIVIHTNSINLYNLISKIGFRFNSKRRKLAEEALKIVYPIQLEEIRKVGAYKKVSELRKKGKTLKEISSILNLPIWNIKSWIYKKRKPRLYNYIKKINNS